MKRRILLLALVIVLSIPAGFIGLISSEKGSRWLLQNITALLPAQVSVASIEGRLLDRILLNGIHYKSATETLTISQFAFNWQPAALLSGRLKIVDISINGVNLSIGAPQEEPQKSNFDMQAGLHLPVQLVLENVLLTDVSISLGDQVYALKKLQFAAATDDNQLTIHSLAVNSPEAEATLQGRIGLGGGFPFNLKAIWKFDAKNNGLWQGIATLSGDFNKLVFDNQLSTPFKLALQGSVEDVLNAPLLTTSGDWQKLAWPLTGAVPQIQSEQGHFELAGLLSEYQLTINAKLNQQYLPEAALSFDGNGSLEAISIKKLVLKSATGLFQLAGDVAWKDAPAFDLSATGQHFNPAIVLAQLPGDLTFTTHLKGKMATNALQLDADINSLSGQLRGYPVSANGKLLLNGDQLKVDALKLVSGVNKLFLDGALGQQQAALNITLDMPALESLWPNLGGSLKGGGFVQGAWKNPTVKFAAKAARLQFAEHSAGQLAIDIDYHPESEKNSTLHLSASALNSGATHITQLLVDGQGTTAQHRFTADIRTAVSDIAMAFTGRLKADTWQGDFSRLDASHQDFGLWQLKKNALVHVTQKAPAVDVAIDESCLVQQAAAICLKGRYAASGDLEFALTTTAVPIKLMQAYFPKQMALSGLISGEANLQRQKGVFSGRYQFAMPPSTVLLTDKKARHALALGASSVSGNIKGDVVSADFDLALVSQDYLRGLLQMNLGKSQALSGQVSASLNEFAMIEPFVPQVSGIKGHLQADLSVKGTAQKPVINGRIDLADGAVDTAQIGLRDINVHALASGGNRIQLQGSATPVPIKTSASEALKIKGILSVDADIQQQKTGLAGHYRLSIPANTSIAFKSGEIVLGASSLSGNINGDWINADIDVALGGLDYCRGKLLMNTGKTQALSGRLSASVSQFGLIESFVPQVSKLKGLLKADVNIGGSLQKPLVNGAINFSKGAVDVANMGLGIREINLQALAVAAQPERIQIQGSAKSGEGVIRLDGFVGLQAQSGWPVELRLTGENFEIAKIPEAQINVSPDMKFLFADGKGKVSGKLTVPKALMVMKDIPENAVRTSKDEIIIGEEKPPEAITAAPGGVDADIAVELGKQVSFSGQGLQTNLEGHLRIITTAGKMTMNGNVDMNKASYKRFGQNLTVRKGRFLFSGPVDNPWLDVEAIRLSKNKKVTAILSLTGPLQRPQTLISSEPSLPEADALAYLITGGPLNQVSKSDSNIVASAALSYGAGQVSWVAGKLGINEFGVEEGETLQDTLVTVGQYLTPEFYVGTKVGLFNKQAVLILKHKITDKINVETQTGTSKRIKLNYEFDTD